jgi:predicted ATP-dependent endonuclease of OLD family
MKVKIKNLGAVEKATIDLKPLTVFVGPNNSGKTWAAYTIASIFSRNGYDHHLDLVLNDKSADNYPPLRIAFNELMSKGSTKIDMHQFARRYGAFYFHSMTNFSNKWLKEYLGTTKASFENTTIEASIKDLNFFLERVEKSEAKGNLSVSKDKLPLVKILKERGSKDLYCYTESSESSASDLPPKAIKELLYSSVFQILHRAIFHHVHIFPTERTTYIAWPLHHFLDLRGNKEKKESIKDAGALISSATSHFVNMMYTAFRSGTSKRVEEAKTNESIAKYLQLADMLEKNILGGNLDYSTPEPSDKRELVFGLKDDAVLDMQVVSSMVKELSPLVIYLRYLAKPDSLLVIDEPEMNLHPEAQVRLAEFLSILTKYRLSIILTTHSSYFVDHLANLIKAEETNKNKSIAKMFFLKNEEAFISKNDVSVYLFEKGTCRSILGKDGMIRWSTFGKVSDKISEIFYKI